MTNVVSRGSRVVGLLACLGTAAVPQHLSAQSEDLVNRLAPLLAAEDARDFQGDLFERSLADPDTLVRRTAIRAIGRLRDAQGIPLLVEVLQRPDEADLHAEAAFALGLIKDSSAAQPLIDWLKAPIPHRATGVEEGIAALAKIGGPEAAAFLAAVIGDPTIVRSNDGDPQYVAVRDAWRLGRNTPVNALLGAASVPRLLRPAIYGLSRLRAREGATLFLGALNSPDPIIRGDAVRALTGPFSGAAGLNPGVVAAALKVRLSDENPGVRINALRALASFRDSTMVGSVAPLLDDRNANVQTTAATALGLVGGHEAAVALGGVLRGHRDWAVRREAFLALARADTALFRSSAADWSRSNDWRDRATVAEGMARLDTKALAPLLADRDPRVVAATLQAWSGLTPQTASPELLAVARADLDRPDPMVRAASAEIISRAPTAGDVTPLVVAWRRAARDSFPDAAENALAALGAIAKGSDSAAVLGFQNSEPAPADPLLKEWAEANWPALAEHWGASRPLATGRTLEDYRIVARRYLVAPDSLRNPRVVIEVADRGSIPLRLFGADAPLTVANFLRLVDRHYFDGQRWHRVVPNFVIQAGDPRGDGNGGPGWAIRDEINRHRYDAWVLGMALSGPDTGGSQWFITLGPQPHLDGTYTVFGELTGGDAIALKVTQGDVIRSIHR